MLAYFFKEIRKTDSILKTVLPSLFYIFQHAFAYLTLTDLIISRFPSSFWLTIWVAFLVLPHSSRKTNQYLQKYPSKCVFKKRCSENIQQIYRITPMPKCASILKRDPSERQHVTRLNDSKENFSLFYAPSSLKQIAVFKNKIATLNYCQRVKLYCLTTLFSRN